jgi:hypothetical protein
MRSLGYGFYGIKYSKENLRYYGKQIRIEKKPDRRPLKLAAQTE